MPVKKVGGGWKAGSYVPGKWFKATYKTKAAAERRAATSKRRSRRKRTTKSRRARRKY